MMPEVWAFRRGQTRLVVPTWDNMVPWGEGREEKERGCAPRVEGDERSTGVEEVC